MVWAMAVGWDLVKLWLGFGPPLSGLGVYYAGFSSSLSSLMLLCRRSSEHQDCAATWAM